MPFNKIFNNEGLCLITHTFCIHPRIHTHTRAHARTCTHRSGIMVKALTCGIVVSEFGFQYCYYVHFPTNPFA